MFDTHKISPFKAEQSGSGNYLKQEFGMEIDDAIGILKFQKRCFFRKGPGVHLVLRGARGSVDVLIMDGEYVCQRIVTGNDSLDCRLIPCPIGSMAIIGKKHEALDQIEQLLSQTIHWHYIH